MYEKKGNTTMTQAEETRELRRWLREDAQKTSNRVEALHKKIDDGNKELRRQIQGCNDENQLEHKELNAKISKIDTSSKVNESRIIGINSIVALVLSSLIFIAFKALAGF